MENPQKLTVLVSEGILKVDLGENSWVYIDASSLRSPHPLLPANVVWLALWSTGDPEEAEQKGMQALGAGRRKSGCLGMVALGIGLVGLGAFMWVVIH